MKRLTIIAFLGVLYCFASTANAQTVSPAKENQYKDNKVFSPHERLAEKPHLFTRLPSRFAVGRPTLDRLFTTGSRRIDSTANRAEFPFEGEITERVQKNPNVISVNIKLSNYKGALLNISRIVNSDLTVSYVGRAININSGDILLLKEDNGKYYFIKEQQALSMVE